MLAGFVEYSVNLSACLVFIFRSSVLRTSTIWAKDVQLVSMESLLSRDKRPGCTAPCSGFCLNHMRSCTRKDGNERGINLTGNVEVKCIVATFSREWRCSSGITSCLGSIRAHVHTFISMSSGGSGGRDVMASSYSLDKKDLFFLTSENNK